MHKILMIAIVASLSNANKIHKYGIFMPNVVPERNETYLCTPMRVNDTYYILGFEPKASQHTAHHMLLFGCRDLGSTSAVWDCGEMGGYGGGSRRPCQSESSLIYAWGLDAPALILPEDVGFKVGGDSPIQYIVLQIHYLDVSVFKNGVTDSSGVTILYRREKVLKTAGILLLATGGSLEPNSEVHMETACVIEEKEEIHPFAYRTHTHKLGRIVSGWKVFNSSGQYLWKLIGKRNPQQPQMFYPVEDPSMVIRKGDIVAARCTMFNFRNHTVYIGYTSEDEMCNFYIMYWTLGGEPLRQNGCYSRGPPVYYWDTGTPRLNNIPPREATSREGAGETPREGTDERSMRKEAARNSAVFTTKFGENTICQRFLESLPISLWLFQYAAMS